MFSEFVNKIKNKDKTVNTSMADITPTAQGWIPVVDITNNHLKRKDDVNVGIIKIEPINFLLLSDSEQKRIIKALSEVMNGLDYSYDFFSIPIPVDLDGFILDLENKKQDESDFIKRKILEEDIRDAAIMASEGEAIDRNYYLLHQYKEDVANDENILLKRSQELEEELTSIGLISQISNDQKIRDLLFNFLNPVQSAYERGPKEGPYLPSIYGG